MMGMRIEGGPATERNGSVRSSAAVAREAGSRTSIRSRKRRRRGETGKEKVEIEIERQVRILHFAYLCERS
jgi:hypothetical protein